MGVRDLMAKIRKRTWTNSKGEQTAWIADYFDQDGKRHIKTLVSMMTRFPVAAIAFLLIGAPYATAVAQSPRNTLMPETIAACREQALSQPQLMALMALDGVSITEVCECQASLFISKLDETWVRRRACSLARTLPFSAADRRRSRPAT